MHCGAYRVASTAPSRRGARREEARLMVQVNTLVSTETVDDLGGLPARDRPWRRSLEPLLPRHRRPRERLAGYPAGPRDGASRVARRPPSRTRATCRHDDRGASLPPHPPRTARVADGCARPDGLRHPRWERRPLRVEHGRRVPVRVPAGSAGNVLKEDIVDIYRSNETFLALRSATGFGGRCGGCNFHAICGGSRARAWAASGNLLGEDPLCTYEPGA